MNNEHLQHVQQYYQESIEIFRQYIMLPATLQHQKIMHHHVSVWESLSATQATLLILSISWWCIMLGFAVIGLSVAWTRYGRPKRTVSLPADKAPGVSILRPLKGVDSDLYVNLESSFRQDYPIFEIIFSVANGNDSAVKVVNELKRRYPKVDARLIVGECDVGVNPKINNIIKSYESAKYDILWVLDSNVYVDPGCLGRSVEKLLLPGVGLVHHLPFAVNPDTFGSELEMMFLDTVHAKMYLAINFIGPDSCVVGKSNIYRKSDLESIGGLAQFGQFMAEDNLIARALWRKGCKHDMTSDLAYQPLGSMSTADYFLRRSRWTRIRKHTVTAATIVEPFTESILCGLLASYGFNLLWQIHPLNFFAFHMTMWFMFDLTLFQTLSGKKIEMENSRGFIMAWALREITALPLYIYSIFGNTVDWRDGTFRLMSNSIVVKIDPPQVSQKRLTFPSLKLNVGVATSRNSLKPWVVSIITSVILVIDIVMDIFFKSQRNGNPEEGIGDPFSLKEAKNENLRRRRRCEMDGGNDSNHDGDNISDERDTTNQDDPIIRAAGRYLKSSLSRTSRYYFGIPYNHPEESEEIDSSEEENFVSSSPQNEVVSMPPGDLAAASSSSACALESSNSSSSTNNQKSDSPPRRRPSLLNEILWGIKIGLSMHLQNEKNAIEGQRRRKKRSTSICSSRRDNKTREERSHVRSMST